MKQPNEMRWVVHPFSYKDEKTEISVIHESDTHGMKSYGWFSDTKVFIACDSMYGIIPEVAKNILRKLAEEICAEKNKAP